MLVDFEAVVIEIQDLARSKKSIGQHELLLRIAEAISNNRVAEGLIEKTTRLYGEELHQILEGQPTGRRDAVPTTMVGSSGSPQ